jgi:hypothetical protein
VTSGERAKDPFVDNEDSILPINWFTSSIVKSLIAMSISSSPTESNNPLIRRLGPALANSVSNSCASEKNEENLDF